MACVDRTWIRRLLKSGRDDAVLVYTRDGCRVVSADETAGLEPVLVLVHRRDLVILFPDGDAGDHALDMVTRRLEALVHSLAPDLDGQQPGPARPARRHRRPFTSSDSPAKHRYSVRRTLKHPGR
ncbi:MAG: hypothetical protein GEV11_27340 [Streptosporangiales bacterium]|nr:hypothetical protein [Streptosporangiales bacterium]